MNAPVTNNSAPNADILRKALNGEEASWKDTGLSEEVIKQFDKGGENDKGDGKITKDEVRELLKGKKEEVDARLGGAEQGQAVMDHLADTTKGGKVDGIVDDKDKLRLMLELSGLDSGAVGGILGGFVK